MSERIVVEMNDGSIAVVCPAPGFTVQMCLDKGDVPNESLQHEVVKTEDVNSDRTFRNAWVFDGMALGKMRESVTKSKEITHGRRRAKRTEEFAPLDVQATIPDQAAAAEVARAAIRTRYDDMQVNIDACLTTEELKAIIANEGI